MNCTQAEQLIPLYVGHDLPAEQAAAVSAHLEHCAVCQAVVAEFAASRNWLSAVGTLAFDEAVFDEMRAALRREITRAEPQPGWLAKLTAYWQPRFATAVTVALLLLLSLSFYAYQQRTAAPKEAPIAHAGENRKQLEPAPRATPGVSDGHKLAVARPQLSSRRSVRRSSVTVRPKKAGDDAQMALKQAANQLAAREMTRIELQTADPNIRIIWFAPKTDLAATFKRN